jgi:hypothetical protein
MLFSLSFHESSRCPHCHIACDSEAGSSRARSGSQSGVSAITPGIHVSSHALPSSAANGRVADRLDRETSRRTAFKLSNAGAVTS